MNRRQLTRRRIIRAGALGVVASAALAGCGETQVVTETRIQEVVKEVPIERVVTQIVEREKPVEVEKVVTQIVEKEVPVERVVTQIVEKEKVVTKVVEVMPPKPKEVQIRWAHWGVAPHRFPVFQRLIDRFQSQFPHITVENEAKTWAQHWDGLAVSYPAGSAPDVAWFSGATFLKYAEDGVLFPIDEFVKSRGVNMGDYFTQADVFDFQGQTYGVPFTGNMAPYFINTRLFEEAGVEEPSREWDAPGWSWTEYREAALKLTKRDAGGKIVQYGTWVGKTLEAGWLGWLIANDADVVNPAKTEMTLKDDPNAREALKFRYDLIQTDQVSPTPADPSMFISGAPDPMARQVVAMREGKNGGSGSATYVAAQIPFDVVPFPTSPNTGHSGSTFNNNPNVIAQSSKQPEEALEWAFSLAGEESQDLLASTKLSMPSIKAAANDPVGAWLRPPPKSTIVMNKGLDLDTVVDLRFTKFWLEWRNKMQNLYEKALIGEADIDETIDAMHDEAQTVLEKT